MKRPTNKSQNDPSGQDRDFTSLLQEIRSCRICEKVLPLGPRPVLQATAQAGIAICGQAPGTKVHKSGQPFDDPSGDRLRQWMGISKDDFYDESKFAIIPMGFCYPGRHVRGGDLPPRPECALTWHDRLFPRLVNCRLKLVIGQYAIAYHLKDKCLKTLTDTVKAWKDYAPDIIPLPHPSPRNNMWLRRNPWFEEEVVPLLRQRVAEILRH